MKAHKGEFNVGLMCDLLEIGRSSFYDWLKSQPSLRTIENQKLSAKIKEVFMESRCNYGTRRIRHVLQSQGVEISRRRVGNLMKIQGLSCKTKRKFKLTTDSNHPYAISPNLLKRNFTAVHPDQKYVGDITYIWPAEGWLYLATVIDLYSRRIVGWSMDKNMKAKLVNDALLMALWERKPKRGLIWHTDRGSQYASTSHRKILKQHHVTQSMSRKGDCWETVLPKAFSIH